MRLQREKLVREKEFHDSQWKFSNGAPPSEHAKLEFDSILRKRSSKPKVVEIPTAAKFSSSAEPRPSAYIPDDIGIPKPYGNMAPFKPTNIVSSIKKLKFTKGVDSLTV